MGAMRKAIWTFVVAVQSLKKFRNSTELRPTADILALVDGASLSARGHPNGRFPMLTKLGILFLGMTVGGVTFLEVGFACFLTITQLQHRTLEARVAQAAVEANQVSTRAKNARTMAEQAPYQRYLVSDSR